MSSNSSPGYTARTYIEFFFNQSGEVLGNGRESGSFPSAADKDIIEESVILDFKKAYLAKAAADEKNNPVAFEAIADHFERVNAAIRTVERKRLEAEPRQIDAMIGVCRPRIQTAADNGRAGTIYARFITTQRAQSSLTHEEAMRDLTVNVLMSPHFSYLIAGAPHPAQVASLFLRVSPLPPRVRFPTIRSRAG